ncbi:hypothetical protein PAXINDRAFT_102443 [Paxillus involutus ATCC 200175]|uniref:Uncharacterized protein n=1 Tax=Paxillus involutus ATCC 200175 TaxID=664439 RepID=A0A0C9TNI3_PAXIN|nr:hypothetical protein PAXINDRAFT_102443 [Paxillus involutus ATCC 200175]
MVSRRGLPSRCGALTSFNLKCHIKRTDVRIEQDRNNIEITVLHFPETKTNHKGEDLSFLRQVPNDPTDSWAALDNHFAINEPPLNLPLFSYRFNAGIKPLQGHGMCIGGTLEYLMRNISFETVKAKGRWKSDAFQLYLRKHAQILAVHMQKHPSLHEEFIRYTMPATENSSKSSSSSYYCGFLRHAQRVVGLLPRWGSQLTSSHTGL